MLHFSFFNNVRAVSRLASIALIVMCGSHSVASSRLAELALRHSSYRRTSQGGTTRSNPSVFVTSAAALPEVRRTTNLPAGDPASAGLGGALVFWRSWASGATAQPTGARQRFVGPANDRQPPGTAKATSCRNATKGPPDHHGPKLPQAGKFQSAFPVETFRVGILEIV